MFQTHHTIIPVGAILRVGLVHQVSLEAGNLIAWRGRQSLGHVRSTFSSRYLSFADIFFSMPPSFGLCV